LRPSLLVKISVDLWFLCTLFPAPCAMCPAPLILAHMLDILAKIIYIYPNFEKLIAYLSAGNTYIEPPL
jgi:hypothetical protein